MRPSSDHYAKGKFFNPGANARGFTEFVRWMTHRERGPKPKRILSKPGPKPLERVASGEPVVTFIHHATVLLQTEGKNILTDPVWSERVGPFSRFGPRRLRAPGIRFEDLPPIDCILISHNHYDHFDTATLKRLWKRDRPVAFCPLELGVSLRKLDYTDVHEMDWWEAQSWGGFKVHCVPAQHFSARTPFDRNRTLWCGWVLESGGEQVYYAGDTGFGPLFEAIAKRFTAIRLALLPIGAFRPEWFMGPIHMTPEQAVEAHEIVRAAMSVAIHYGTFLLADDGLEEPVERLRRALENRKPDAPFLLLSEGEGYRVDPSGKQS